jgi:hypothetical protein
MKNSITVAQQAKRIQNKYKGRTDELSMKSMHRELADLEAQQEALRQQMNLDNSQEMYAWGGPGGYVNQPDNNLLAMGGLIKRADGSYSQKGLWDNIRANKGSGKKPTKQMLEQEKKIKQMAMGGYMYADGGKLPKEILRSRVESHMSPEEADDYINEYGNGGYTVKRSSDRKGKTHVVIGPDGTKKYFGDSNLGQHPNDPARKKAFYARHKKNLAGNPYFRAFARKTWADGGEIDPMNFNYGGIAQAFDYGGIIQPMMYAEGGGIHIDPSKKGTFTAAATKHGKSVQGFASQVLANKENYSPAMVKKANFARNASKWHHAYGGPAGMYFEGPGDEYNGVYNEEGAEPVNQMMRDYFFNRYPSTTNTSTNTEEFQMPYDQMANTFGSPYARNYNGPFVEQPMTKVPITKTSEIKIPQSKIKIPQSEISNKPVLEKRSPQEINYKFKERNQPFNYAGLAEFAGPLMDLYYGIKGPDQVNFDRVKAEEINLAPGVTADLIRRSYSPAMYAAKQQGLGQGSYLNMLGALSSEASENEGKSYLQSKLAQEQYNAGARNAANIANAQIGMQESIARQQERDAARSAVTKGAGELGKGVATLSLDPRLETAQSKQNKIMRALIKSQNPALDIDSILSK